jgi:CrcB protein
MPGTPPHLAAAIALVALGGAVGSAVRYLIALASAPVSSRFPSGTLFANTVGCLLAGVLLFFVIQRDQPSPHLRLLLALLNIAANVIFSLGAVALGFAAARALA